MAPPVPTGARPADPPRPSSLALAPPRTILAATLVAALLRLPGLGGPSLWIDEQFTLLAAGLPGPFDPLALLGDVHGPLYTLAVAFAAALGGDAEWVLRLPSAIAGVATVPAMAWLAGRWLGPAAVAPAAWLAAGSPFLVYYSQECRNYSFVLLATVLSLGAALGLRDRADGRRIAGWLATVVAGVFSNFAFVLVAPLQVRLLLAPGEARARRLRLLVGACVVVAIVAAPWVPAVVGTWDWARLVPGRAVPAAEVGLRGEHTFHPAAIPFTLHTFTSGYGVGPSLRELRSGPTQAVRDHALELALAAALFAVLGGLGLRAVARRGRLADTLLWLVAPMLVVSYFAATNFKVFHPRYLAAAMPCVLLVVAAAFADAAPRTRRVLAWAVALLWSVSLARGAFDPDYGREDYRTAMTHVRAGIGPGERVLAVGAPEPVEWYGRGLEVRRFWLGYASDEARLSRAWRDSVGAPPPGLWVVASRTEDLDPEGRFARRLDGWTTEQDRSAFAGVRVWHLRERTTVDDSAGVVGPAQGSR